MDEAKNKLSEIKIKISDIQENKELSNTEKENKFADYIKGIDNESIKQAAQDFDILKGSVDKFSEESLVNLYASQIKNTQGFVGVRSAIASYNDACKKGEEESNLVAKAIGKTNTSLGDHLTACNGAKTSMAKYAGKLALVKAQQLLVRASTMALNMAFTMGVSTVLSLVFGAFDKLIVTEEELSDKAEELKSKYEETTSAIKDNLKTVEGFSDEFKKLSEGVDSQGKNISLTSEQYNRYKEIVKQLIEINPNLMTGYNNEHEALINNNNALQKTIDLLKEKSRLQEVEFSSDDSLKTFTKDIMQDVKSAQEFIDNFNSDTTNRQVEIAGESLLQGLSTQRFNLGVNSFTGNAKRQYEEINKILEVNKTDKQKADEMMYQFLVDNRDSFGMIESQYDEYTKDMTSWAVSIKKNLDTYNNSENTVYDSFGKIRENIKHVLYSYDGYDEMSPGAKNFLEGYVENLKFDPKSSESEIINKVLEYKEEILLMLKDIDDSKISDEFKKIFEIDTSKTTVNDYTKQVDEIVKNIAKTDFAKKNNLTENDIKISLGLSIKTDDGNVKDKMAELRNDIKKQLSEQFGESEAIDIKVDSLTVDELKALDGIDFSQYKTLDEAITHAVKEAHKFDLSSYKDDIDNVQDRVSKLSSALEKLKSGELSDAERIDLAQEFTDLTPYINDTEKLQQAIQKLIQTEPNDLISDLEDLKKNLKTEEEVEQVDNLIKILQKLGIVSSKKDAKTAESTGKTKEELANEYLELQEKKIDNIIDKIEDRKKAEEKVLDSMQKEKDAMEEQLKILQEEKEEIEEKEETISKKVSEYETAGNTAISFLDDKIQELNDAKDALEKSYDDEIKNTQDKYNDEIDALKEKNDAINRSIELKKAEDELYNARNTKVRVYSEAGGFEEQVNASAVREKEQNLSSLKRGYKIEDLESERDKAVKKIETDKENDPRLAQYEKDIKAYEDYKKSFEDMVNSYERNQNNLTAARILGANWHEQVTNKDIGLIQRYGKEYNGYQIQLNEDIPLEIEAKEHAIEKQEKVIENQDNAIQKQQEVIDSHDEEIQSWNEYKDDLNGAVEEIGKTNDEYVTSLDNVVLSEKSSYEDRVREAKKFKQTIVGILGSDDVNEVNSLADDYLNSNDNSKKSTKKSEKKYKLYYTDAKGEKHTLDTFSDNISAINYKMDMVANYADRYVGHAKSLNKRFGIKLTDDANEYGIRQALSNAIKIKAYAKGGINDFTGLAMMHGTKQKSEVVFNSADAKKLYDYIHTSNNLPEMLMNNVSNSIAKMFSEITTKMGQNAEFNSNSSSKSTSITIQINNPNIQADNYEQFERCMSQYITKQKLDTWVGK